MQPLLSFTLTAARPLAAKLPILSRRGSIERTIGPSTIFPVPESARLPDASRLSPKAIASPRAISSLQAARRRQPGSMIALDILGAIEGEGKIPAAHRTQSRRFDAGGYSAKFKAYPIAPRGIARRMIFVECAGCRGTKRQPKIPADPQAWDCRERDSNPHALRRRILSPLRLPIPPPRHGRRHYP